MTLVNAAVCFTNFGKGLKSHLATVEPTTEKTKEETTEGLV